tara:strand:+ start:102 stop:269 length:168 start_codon:yes stop_codon:yes gene_type:complete
MGNVQQWFRQNFDSRTAFSSAVGAAGLGVVAYLAARSKIKPLSKAAKVATTGKAK